MYVKFRLHKYCDKINSIFSGGVKQGRSEWRKSIGEERSKNRGAEREKKRARENKEKQKTREIAREE